MEQEEFRQDLINSATKYMKAYQETVLYYDEELKKLLNKEMEMDSPEEVRFSSIVSDQGWNYLMIDGYKHLIYRIKMANSDKELLELEDILTTEKFDELKEKWDEV